jgi:hypothetical protein
MERIGKDTSRMWALGEVGLIERDIFDACSWLTISARQILGSGFTAQPPEHAA